MKLDDAKAHLQELLRVCQGKADLDKDYLRRVVLFCDDFQTWIPEIYITMDNGMVSEMHGNCNIHPHVIYNDNESREDDDSLEEMNKFIEEQTEGGFLKTIIHTV